MPIETFPLGPLETNCHVISTDAYAVVVDPGGDPAPVMDYLRKNKLSLVTILVTHLHFDHIYGVAALHKATGTPVLTPPGDAYLMQSELGSGGMWGFPPVENFPATPLEAGEHAFGPLSCTALLTPGHTLGSISLYFSQLQAVFSGDVLFYRSVGRSDFPGGDQATLLRSIREKLYTLPGATHVYPGHGLSTVIEDEKLNNPYCSAFAR